MPIRFFFEYSGLVIQLPVNPESIAIRENGNNQAIEIVKVGEASVLRAKKLRTLEIKCFFPSAPDPLYVLTKGKFQGPQFYVDFFRKALNDKKPMKLVISDIRIDMLVSIEEFEHGVIGGDDDVQYKLQLKEFKLIGAKPVAITQPTTNNTSLAIQEPTIITTSPVIVREKTGFAIGDVVVANGSYWSTSYGDPPFGTFKDFAGKIGHIVADTTRQYRYAIYTLEGGARGWVSEEQLRHR